MITIQRTPLSYRIKTAPNCQLLETNLHLSKYLNRFGHTVWDRRQHRSVLYRMYLKYDKKSSTLFLPQYDFESFCGLLNSNNIPYAVEEIPLQLGIPVDIPLKHYVKDRSEIQTKAIEYLTTSPESMRGLSLGTGQGKTYCFIKAASIIGRRTMLCVAGLIEQWENAILNFTELTKDDIYIIQGAASLTKLLLQIDKTIFPKFIICSLGTIRAYANGDDSYENYPPFTELMNRLKVGVKGIDEAHLNFYLTYILDLQTNAAVNIALTATFDRGDYQVKQIFDLHYPRLMRFGEGEYKRYIDIKSYSYSIAGNAISSKHYMTEKGYNQSKLEEWMLRKGRPHLDYIYKHVYSPIIYSHYINCRRKEQKLLVLCSTIMMCDWFEDKIIEDIPSQENLRVETYNYGTDRSILNEADIIVSTPGSAGTGTDIENLRTVLMTIASGSDILNKQSLGRLRELPNGDTPIYAYTWIRNIQAHCNYQEIRRVTYTSRGKSFQEINL